MKTHSLSLPLSLSLESESERERGIIVFADKRVSNAKSTSMFQAISRLLFFLSIHFSLLVIARMSVSNSGMKKKRWRKPSLFPKNEEKNDYNWQKLLLFRVVIVPLISAPPSLVYTHAVYTRDNQIASPYMMGCCVGYVSEVHLWHLQMRRRKPHSHTLPYTATCQWNFIAQRIQSILSPEPWFPLCARVRELFLCPHPNNGSRFSVWQSLSFRLHSVRTCVRQTTS